MPATALRLPPALPNLRRVDEMLTALVQEFNARAAALEPQLAAHPNDARLRATWGACLDRIAALNDVLTLLQVPTVRALAMMLLRRRQETAGD